MSIEDLRAKAKPRQAKARILADGSLRAQHAALEADLVAANHDGGGQLANPELRAIAEQLVDLEERIVAAEDEFTFQSIGTTAWYKLLGEHPPVESGTDHNAITFPPAAIAASCVEPEITLDDAMWLRDTLDMGEWLRLWNACLLVNLGEAGRPKSQVASAILRLSAMSSPTAPPEESLGASS